MFTFYFNIYVAQVPGTTQDHLQIFNIEAKAKLKSHQMPEQVSVDANIFELHYRSCYTLRITLNFSVGFFFG